MVQKTNPLSDELALVAVIDPDANAVGTINSGWVSMTQFQCVVAYVFSGIMGAAGTLDFKLQQATDSAGTGAKDITGAAITQFVKATNDDDQACIQLQTEDLDIANDFNHVRMVLTTGTATGDSSAAMFGECPRYGVASNNDLASVVEIVTV